MSKVQLAVVDGVKCLAELLTSTSLGSAHLTRITQTCDY